ncbi:MAG: hypothetical protein ACRD2X_24785 [Vicinamibacteraceae bacterium]
MIQWILDQHRGKPACFLNNVRHGDHDPYTTAEQASYYGFGSAAGPDTVRLAPKHLLIYSYEDDLSKMRADRSFLESVRDEAFERNRDRYLGASSHRLDVIILRDPFNFFASRLKKLNALTGVKHPDVIRQDWKSLAAEALHAHQGATHDTLFLNYNRWFRDKAHRRQLSSRLRGTFSDASLTHVPGLGGGSSFDAGRLTWGVIRARWRKLLEPRVYLRLAHYWNRLFAPDGEQMKVLERWKTLQDDISYQKIFADRELFELSQRLFGELPGTRDFVARCCERHDAGERLAHVVAHSS